MAFKVNNVSLLFIIANSVLVSLVRADFTVNSSSAELPRPHIVFILADDLGWNDVGFHGLDQIPTPNIDALAYTGIILNNYYTVQLCTPSRSAIMTGKHPIHTGMQHNVLYGLQAGGLPLSEKLLPQYLKEMGYRTRLVGKWHLGFYTKEYTPTYRGFESHLGYWSGHHDYFDHFAEESHMTGLDMRRNMQPAWELHGKYSTEVFTNEAVSLIKQHDKGEPLFLYLAHAATHSANPYQPLQAPDRYLKQYRYIADYARSRFAGMLHAMDESVGKVVEALEDKGMLENSVIVFCTDNGGAAAGFNLNAASNWPLRGVKNTLWEGGVRGPALIWSPLLKSRGFVADQYMHVTDWLPTLLSAAKYNGTDLQGYVEGDGIDTWEALSSNLSNNRTTILHNIDDLWKIAALTRGDWKIVKGNTYGGAWDAWYGPSGRHGDENTTAPYDHDLVINSLAGQAVQKLGYQLDVTVMNELRQKANVNCSVGESVVTACEPGTSPCLFNIKTDPCERNNLAARYPEILEQLESAILNLNRTAVKPVIPPIEERGDPKYFQHVWTNFGDYEQHPGGGSNTVSETPCSEM